MKIREGSWWTLACECESGGTVTFKARLQKAEMTKGQSLAVSWIFLSSEYHFCTFCHRITSLFVFLKNNFLKNP